MLRCRWLLPLADRPLDNAWLRIERGRVTGLGRGPVPGSGSQGCDPGDAIIMPGLVNAHTHLEFSGCDQPFATAGGLPDWISRVVAWRRQAAPGGLDLDATVRAGLRELAADGIVAVGEIATAAASVGSLQHGPRLRVFRELLGLAPLPGRQLSPAVTAALRETDRLARAGIAVGFSPHAPYSTQRPLGHAALRTARRLRSAAGQRCTGRQPAVPLAMHLAESADEGEFLSRQCGPFRDLFEQLGVWPERVPQLASTADWISLLARADRGLVVHGTHLPADPVAFARLCRHRDRLAVAVCPRTTQALAGRLPPVVAFRAAGLRVCLGTDGRGSNPDLSLRAEGRCLIDAGIVSPAEALRMVTVNAAWALGFERLTGRIAVGRPADLAILRPGTTPATAADAAAAVFAADTRVIATLRGGRLSAGALTSPGV